MTPQTADESFQLALRHLERVRGSWDDPSDWADLSFYGLYCLEACIVAAVLHVGWPRPKTHRSKEKAAIRLTSEYGLPDVAGLLVLLNDVRKHEAYGDVIRPDELDPENAAREIEDYVETVSRLIG